MGNFIRKYIYYISLAIFLITLIISAGVYYILSQKTVREYDNAFVEERNQITSQIDSLTNVLNSTSEEEEIDKEIKELDLLYQEFNSKLEQEELAKDGTKIKELNQDFSNTVEKILLDAQEYQKSIDDVSIDIVEVLEDYNANVVTLNGILDEIKTEVESSKII